MLHQLPTQLDPNKQWFIQINATAAGKAGKYALLDITCSGQVAACDIKPMPTLPDPYDDGLWQLADKCKYSLDEVRKDPVIAEGETLNKDDVSDFRMISLDHSGFFNYTLSSDDHNANVTATLYKWNADGSALVKVNAVTVNTKNNTAQLKSDVFLTQGDYYIEVTCANTAKGGYAVYDLMFNAPVVFDSPYISTDDDSIFTAAAISVENPSENFVCIDDAIDYFKWVLDDAAYGNLVLSSKDHNANVTATLYKWNNNGSALTKVTTLTLSTKADTAQLKKDLLLDKGEYFISVTCANTAKGGYADYTLSLQTPVVFNHNDLNNQDDNMAGAQKLLSSTGTVVEEGFVGYGDTVDFLKLNDIQSGNHTFEVSVSGKARFTLYRYDLKSNKLVAVVSTKTLAAGNNTLAAVHLEAGVDYYFQVQAADVKSEVIYGIESKVNAAKYISAQYDQNETLSLEAAAKGEETIVNFDVSSQDAGWFYTFNDSSLGDMQLFMYDEAKGNLKQIKFKEGASIALAQGSYYLKLQASGHIADGSCLVFDAETRSFSWNKAADPQLA